MQERWRRGAGASSAAQKGVLLGACLEIAWGPAARDFDCGQGGETGASPQRAVTVEPTQATDKRPAAQRVFAEKAAWLCCFSVEDRCGYPPSARLAIRPSPRKQDSHGISKQALRSSGNEAAPPLSFESTRRSRAFSETGAAEPQDKERAIEV